MVSMEMMRLVTMFPGGEDDDDSGVTRADHVSVRCVINISTNIVTIEVQVFKS